MERNRPLIQTSRAIRSFGRILSWCREHVLSLAVVLAFPLAIAAFFWSRGAPEDSGVPDYWSGNYDEESETGETIQPKLEEAAVISVVPDASILPPAPRPFRLGDAAEPREFLKPLPATVETLDLIENRNPSACVWLTGQIEPLDAAAELMQSASRVHELTRPARN